MIVPQRTISSNAEKFELSPLCSTKTLWLYAKGGGKGWLDHNHIITFEFLLYNDKYGRR